MVLVPVRTNQNWSQRLYQDDDRYDPGFWEHFGLTVFYSTYYSDMFVAASKIPERLGKIARDARRLWNAICLRVRRRGNIIWGRFRLQGQSESEPAAAEVAE